MYSLVPGLAREVVEEELETEGNRCYRDVAKYLATEEKLTRLQGKVGEGRWWIRPGTPSPQRSPAAAWWRRCSAVRAVL